MVFNSVKSSDVHGPSFYYHQSCYQHHLLASDALNMDLVVISSHPSISRTRYRLSHALVMSSCLHPLCSGPALVISSNTSDTLPLCCCLYTLIILLLLEIMPLPFLASNLSMQAHSHPRCKRNHLWMQATIWIVVCSVDFFHLYSFFFWLFIYVVRGCGDEIKRQSEILKRKIR